MRLMEEEKSNCIKIKNPINTLFIYKPFVTCSKSHLSKIKFLMGISRLKAIGCRG